MGKTRDSGALLLIISTLMVKILGVLYKVPLTYILTEEGMGYFNTAYTVYGFFYILCSTGIPKAVTMQVSSQIEGENKTQIFHLYNKGFTFVSVILLGLFILLAKPVSLILGVSGAYYSLLSISPAVFFAAISSLYRGYLVGVGKVGGIAVASFIEALCKFIFGLLFAQIGVSLNISLFSISAFTVLGISIGGFLSTLIMYICCKTSIKRDNQGQKVSIDAKETIYDLIKIALPITLSSLAINLGGLLDLPILISGLSRYITNEGEIVALYGNYSTLGLPMFNLIISLTSPLALTLLPKLCTTITEGKADYNKLIKNTTNLSMLLTAMSVAVFYFFSFDILDILFSSQASVNGYRTLIYLSLSLLFFVPFSLLQNF